MPSNAISASSTASGARRMNRPVRIEFATFQCWLTSKVSGFSGVAPRSVRSLPVALEPTTTSLPFQRSGSSFVCPSSRRRSCQQQPLNGFLRQLRMVGRQTPVDVEVALGIDRDDCVPRRRGRAK